MVARNDITGDKIQSKDNSKAYSDNYDKIFSKNKLKFTEQELMNMEVIQDMIDNPKKKYVAPEPLNEYPDNSKDA